MPKGRMLNKKISYDENVSHMSVESTLIYTWCIAHLDVDGRLYGDPYILKGLIVPYIDTITPELITKAIEEMSLHGLVVAYGSNRKYLWFIGFTKNQKLNREREGKSEIPSPPDELLIRSGVTQEEITAKLSKDKLSKVKLIEVEKVLELWNKTELPKVQHISKERKDKLSQRLKSKHFRDNYEDAIKKLALSSFALGKNERGWKASFDWFISNDTNYVKAIEGKYDDKGQSLIDKYRRL